jgi:hypothetical protein
MKLDEFHTFDEFDGPEIEVYWYNKSKRDKAVRLLKRYGIVVDVLDYK